MDTSFQIHRMKTPEDLSAPLDDFEYDELGGFLSALERDSAVQNMSEFDGFVTALVSGPELVLPSEWLPTVWGGESNSPAVESSDEFKRVMSLMIRHMNSTAATLAEDPQSFEPFFLENVVKGKTYLVVDDWCIGYMKAVFMRPERWRVDDEDIVDLLAPIPLFTSDDGWALLDQLADRHLAWLQEQVAPAARALHAYWLGQRGEFYTPGGLSVH
jgi:uncharacterized protein